MSKKKNDERVTHHGKFVNQNILKRKRRPSEKKGRNLRRRNANGRKQRVN
jgi:hypothetical protein